VFPENAIQPSLVSNILNDGIWRNRRCPLNPTAWGDDYHCARNRGYGAVVHPHGYWQTRRAGSCRLDLKLPDLMVFPVRL